MKITISTTSPDKLNHEMLVLGFFSDERPPKGYCGLVDWRLNGIISAEMAQGGLTGDFLDKLLYAFPERIRVSRLLLFGIGPLAQLTYDRIYNAGYEIAGTVSGIHATDIVIPVPAAGRGTLTLAGMSEALFTGIFDGFARKPEEIPLLYLEVPAQPNHISAIREGLERFLKHIGTAEVEILESEDPAAVRTKTVSRGLLQKQVESFV